jgi:hypothetical protein
VKERIGKNYKGRQTLSLTILKNGSKIFKFPVGQTGIYLEGLSSIDFLYADESIHIPKKVWDSIVPMLAEPKKRGFGWITLLSSTRGKPKGFFFESFQRDDFLKIQIKAEDCEHISKEFLESEKKRLGERFYNVIYNGEFDERAMCYFSPELIDKSVKIGFFLKKDIKPDGLYYLGIDPARYGKSKAAFAVSNIEGEKVRIIYAEEIDKSSLSDLRDETLKLENQFRFRKIFIDDGGLGAGLIDFLEEIKEIKKKLRPINNAAAGAESKILKEDLYSNVLNLLSSEKLELLNDSMIINGLKKVEFSDEEKILGTDMSEAIARACWGVKEKNKKIKMLRF